MSSSGHAGWAAAAALLLAAGCNASSPDLLLYCGAGIRPPAAEVAAEFGRLHGVSVECDYAGSEVLLSRIELAGRGDLYMPGDVRYVEQAVQRGLVAEGDSKTVCYFVPVILVQKGNPKQIQSLSDLTQPDLKLGLGDPQACAIGRQSLKIFQKNEIPQEEIDRNVVFRSLTVNELGTLVKLQKIDAAIVWDALAAYYPLDADVVAIPLDQNVVSTVPVAILNCSTNRELAQKFVRFVTSDEGAAVFAKHHYTTTPPQ